MSKKEIIFYAPFGHNIPAHRCGGAEAGCRKTLNIYKSHGYNVITIDKPAGAQGLVLYAKGILTVPFLLIYQMLCHRDAPVHIVGFYRGTSYYELLLMTLCLIFRHKTIYELRNGSMVDSYKNGTWIYRHVLERLLLAPDVVLCQGWEYVNFIHEKLGRMRSYYPNYIMDDFLLPNNLERKKPPIHLVYFGRVTPEKHVDISIEILAILNKRGYEAILDIFGGVNTDYEKELRTQIEKENLKDVVFLHGRKSFSDISDNLRYAHYFLFPSTEKQEGHSNSLTEAMGYGVVPIVSRAGFNASICGNEDLVVDGINPQDYANTIIRIEKEKQWSLYSNFVYQRVLNNYTESIVGGKLISTIEKLYE